ncbi:SIR2 family protein [Aeromonas salmonicida]|uniref:SIR2 family protein n=1 Tax=Aeromonas salmonicida TaxID=645 RepID=UPI003CFC785E
MDIHDFISGYKNHPILFIGTGFSLRYLQNSFSWDALLSKISLELTENPEFYLDIKASSIVNGSFCYETIAQKLEQEFNSRLSQDRNGKFKNINDYFYSRMTTDNKSVSRFKIYITSILQTLNYREGVQEEIDELKKTRKNISSIITTNYDCLVEDIFDFIPLIGNNILLSNPYGSAYKIHGCVTEPNDIIITKDDYSRFNDKYELIRAQLLSMFIHNPIVFLGYSISDNNIKKLLRTIFSYVDVNTDLARKIRNNFLLVEYEPGNDNSQITEHDIELEGVSTIRINKIKTDNYTVIYKALSELVLPVSAMDIRKVQKVWSTIRSGGNIKVNITENLDELRNEDMVIAVGSEKTVKYEYQTTSEMIQNYFNIVEESNSQLISLLNKQTVPTNVFFPIFAFSKICDSLENTDRYKKQQLNKLTSNFNRIKNTCDNNFSSHDEIVNSTTPSYKKEGCIFYAVLNKTIRVTEIKKYLLNHSERAKTACRQLLCLYDVLSYGDEGSIQKIYEEWNKI